jgi:hypothetical protein
MMRSGMTENLVACQIISVYHYSFLALTVNSSDDIFAPSDLFAGLAVRIPKTVIDPILL